MVTDTVLRGFYLISCTICLVFVGEWTYHWSEKQRKKYFAAGICYAVAFFFCNVRFTEDWLFLLFYIAEITSWSFICDAKTKGKVAKMVALTFEVGFLEEIIQFGLHFFAPGLLSKTVGELLGIWMAFAFFSLICKQSWYQKIVTSSEKITKRQYVLILFLILINLVMIGLGESFGEMLDSDFILSAYRLCAVMELIAVAGILIWFVRESYQKKYYYQQTRMKEEILHMQQAYFQVIYQKDTEMRRFRHDIASQLGMLQLLLEQDEVEKARAHLNTLVGEFTKASLKKIHVGDERLDAVLTMMYEKAREQGVVLEVKGRLEEEASIDAYELCTVFANAIANAVEACKETDQEKKVSLKIVNHQKTLYCMLTNPATQKMYQAVQARQTTKADRKNHGLGRRNMQDAVERMNGTLTYQYKDGKVILEVYV